MKASRSFSLSVSLVVVTFYSGLAADVPFLQSKLFAPDAASGDYFGWTVALAGDRAVIGTELDGSYVFVRRQHWEFEQKLTPDLGVSPLVGRPDKVLMGNDRILIVVNDYIPTGQGKALIYERREGSWTMVNELTIPAGTRLEGDAAMHQDTIVLAARDGIGATPPVSALVYKREGSSWVLQQKIIPSSTLFLYHGISCAVHGNTLALGVQGANELRHKRSAVYMYSQQGGSWTGTQTLVLEDNLYAMGYRIALEGTRLAVGVPALDVFPGLEGMILVFAFDGVSWVEEQRLQVAGLPRPYDFGRVVALSGDRIVAGMPVPYSESAFLFERTGADLRRPWSAGLRLSGDDTNGWNGFGGSVAVNKETFMIGSPRSGQPLRNYGGVYVFEPDVDAPVIESISAAPAVLSPPNHKMTAVKITVNASDNSGTTACRIVRVTNSEAGLRDKGSQGEDVQITGDLELLLRAERSGNGIGRVYTITVECRDPAGNTSTGSTSVLVPR
jgi:hypothetical protein